MSSRPRRANLGDLGTPEERSITSFIHRACEIIIPIPFLVDPYEVKRKGAIGAAVFILEKDASTSKSNFFFIQSYLVH